MKKSSLISLCALAACAPFVAPTLPAAPENGKSADKASATAGKSTEWLAAARAAYPLDTCVVADEKLDEDAFDYVHKEAGKPDRLIRVCCEPCIDDFKKDPAAYLKKIDDAARAKADKTKAK
jgi:hypothetical protein